MRTNDWSVSEPTILETVGSLIESNRDGVLATIVDVEGNAYRRPGAKLLIGRDEHVGNVTAGCLEDEVASIADEVLEDGKTRIETFDLMEDEEDLWGLGIGCNGIIDMFLEPVDEGYLPAVEAASGGENVALVTILESEELPEYGRAIYRPSTGVTEADLPMWARTAIERSAETLLNDERSRTVRIVDGDRSATVFVDSIVSPPKVAIFGTGPDVKPVVDLAKKSGFDVTVVGFRGAAATEDAFPNADRVLSTSPADVRDIISFDGRTYTVVMTHNFLDDRLTVDELVKTPVPYVGLMGPRNRFEEMMSDFASEGRSFDQRELDRIYTPIGLDLGGGEPYQIAHSIVAEILAVHNDRTPTHLKVREGPIHDRVEVETT